jgi:hypothetical protein
MFVHHTGPSEGGLVLKGLQKCGQTVPLFSALSQRQGWVGRFVPMVMVVERRDVASALYGKEEEP